MVRSLIAVLAFAAAAPAQPRTDAHGDPLPDGAIARFGTIRDRVGSPRVLYSAALSPDGKTLAAETRQGITLWDVDSGRPALRFPWYTWQGFRPQFALDFSADGKRLARMAGRVVQVFEVKSGKVLFDRDIKDKDNVRSSRASESGKRSCKPVRCWRWSSPGRMRRRSYSPNGPPEPPAPA